MEFQMPSGTTFEVTPAPFKDAHRLLKAILKTVKDDIELSPAALDITMTLEGLKGDTALFGQIIEKVLSVAVSDEVEAALHQCFLRCHYGSQKLVADLFDDPSVAEKIREDYFTICMKVIEVNCKPFFKQTFSELLKSQKKTPAIPE